MPRVHVNLECPVRPSFRVKQVAGMFDLPPAKSSRVEFSAELPEARGDWRIGAIVGPSGSGKTMIARQAYGAAFHDPHGAGPTRAGDPHGAGWPADRTVVDAFGERPVKAVTLALTAVGFSSPPAWLRPYAILSTGERFRCDLARALLLGGDLVVFDEFTSVVDRTVAKVCSAAVAKAVRGGTLGGGAKRFVAVTCHYDVLDWLESDWVLDLATGCLERGRLRRPAITLEIVRCRHAAWRMFAHHHYLSGALNPASESFLATWEGLPVAFVAVVPLVGKRDYRRVSRIVVLPDYQGVGIGSAVLDQVCSLYPPRGLRIGITTSHPAMIRHLCRSSAWRRLSFRRTGNAGTSAGFLGHRLRTSLGRAVASFRFVGTYPRKISKCEPVEIRINR